MPLSLQNRLERHVRHLAEGIGERHFRKPQALAAAAAYIREQLAETGVEVREHEFEVAGQLFVNLEVVAERAGAQLPEADCIVVGAHYDSVPGTPGADDNASGIAALIELVRELGHTRGERTLRFAFFPNEEPPFFPDAGMGSAFYAGLLRRDGVGVFLMVSLEMLGFYSDAERSQKYPPGLGLLYPSRGNFISFISNLSSRQRLGAFKRAFQDSSSFPCESLAAPEWTVVVGLSDHRSFWQEGYPALMVTDTAFMRNPHYHQATDTPDTLDYARFAQVTAGLIATLRRLAGSDRA
jgi:Zn-dependent M28 family amino/carboxypeptidase